MKQRTKKLFLVENGREPASANEFVAPPNATIQIILELFSKKVFNEGEGYDRQIDVKLIGKLHDGTIFVNKGDNEVVDGIDRGVKTMKNGEVASLTIHPEYAFGSTELYQESVTILVNSNVYYVVDLVSFEKEKDSWELNTPEKIETYGRNKEEGNTIFKKQKYERASKRY
nr:hypothetical protein [Tanacetum cinerariifolium]